MKKKIMFILCTVVILCVSSIVNAATLKDVKNTKYEDSVNTLITLGIVNGYEEDDGTYTYKPDNVVTRAEMAKLMVVALGQESNVASAKNSAAKFKDVKSSDWEYGYVNLASELGIINGYPDGTFGSKNTVSYAEATAMIIRALEYEDEVNKSTEVWPNNYISQAKKLSLYDSIGTVNSSDGAKRGNVAILLWNMLRTGVCTAVGQNSTGIVYGEGDMMLNKMLADFVYLEDGLVTDVDFDDDYEEAEVKIKGEQTIKITMDALEAAKMYGQRYDVLYNVSSDEIEQITESDSNKTKEGEIEKVTSSKIYIDGGSSKGYDLPDDDNILLYGVEELDEAVSALLVFDGSTLEYVVGFAPDKVYLALVTDNDVTVSSKDGIKVVNYKASSAKSYALMDEDDVPDEDDVILYYLNGDNELVVIGSANVFDSKEITSASTTKIKFGNNTYKFADGSYQIVKVSSSSLKSMSASDIEDGEDSACLIEFAGERYFIIFVGGVEKATEDLEDDVAAAVKTLSTYMSKSVIKAVLNNETTYTQSTFATFMNAYETAETAIESANSSATSSNLTKVNNAYSSLQSAYSSLKKITSLSSSDRANEKEIVEAKSALRKIVNGTTSIDGKKVTTCVEEKASYTSASYSAFETTLNSAKTLLKSTKATLAKIETATSNLTTAIKGLVKTADDNDRKEQLSLLEDVLKVAEEKAKNKADYTETSYSNFLARWNEAKIVKSSTTATADEIKTVRVDLENAIKLLSENLDEISAKLNKLLLEAQVELDKKETYMPETYNDLEDAYNAAEEKKSTSNVSYEDLEKVTEDLEEALNNLVVVSTKLAEVKKKAASYRAENIKELLADMDDEDFVDFDDKVAKIKKLEKAMAEEDDLIDFYKNKLTKEVAEASAIEEADWSENIYVGSYANMKIALAEANKILAKSDATSDELKNAYVNLDKTLELK